MGVFRVEVEFANAAGPERCVVDAVVDTGATLSLLPATVAHDLHLVAIDRRAFQLASGEQVSYDLALVQVSYGGFRGGTTVAIGDDRAGAILGAAALEVLGFAVDPVRQLLVRTTSWMLSSVGPEASEPAAA